MGKNSKRIISIVISALMLISLMSVFCVPTFAEPIDFATSGYEGKIDGVTRITQDAILLMTAADAEGKSNGDTVTATWDGVEYNFIYGDTAATTDTHANACTVPSLNVMWNNFCKAKNGGKAKTMQIIVPKWDGTPINELLCDYEFFAPNYDTCPYIADGYGYQSESYGENWVINPEYEEKQVKVGKITLKNHSSWANAMMKKADAQDRMLGFYGFTMTGPFENARKTAALGCGYDNFVFKNILVDKSSDSSNYIFKFATDTTNCLKEDEGRESALISNVYLKTANSNLIYIYSGQALTKTTLDGLYIPEEAGSIMVANGGSSVANSNSNFTFTIKNSNIRGMNATTRYKGFIRFVNTKVTNTAGRKLEITDNIFYDTFGYSSGTNNTRSILNFEDVSNFGEINFAKNYVSAKEGDSFANFAYAAKYSATCTTNINITENVFNGFHGLSLALGASEKAPDGDYTADKNFLVETAVSTTSGKTTGAAQKAINDKENVTVKANNYYAAYDFTEHEFSDYSSDLKEIKVGETTSEADEGDGKYKVTLQPGADEQITAAAYDTREGHVTVEVKQGESVKDTVDADACKAPVEYTITLTDTCNSSAKEYTLTVTREHNWAERVTQDPTCQTPGTKEHYCTVCQTVKAPDDDTTVEADPENGHKFTKTDDRTHVKTMGDCTNPTVYYKTCEYCGISAEGHDENATFEGEVVSDAHRWKDEHISDNVHVTQAATCDKDGEGYVECELNPEHHKTITIEKLNPDGQHTWKGWEDDAEKPGYEKDECTVCSATREREKPKIDSASLTLYDNIDVNFKVKKSALDGYTSDEYSSPYIEVELNGETTKIETPTEGEIKPVDSDTTPAYVFTFTDIAPQMMGDTLTAKLYATKDGEPVLLDSFDYSVKQYCTSMLDKTEASKEEYTEFRAMLVDMLNYGAAAQTYTNHNADSLVNADLGDAADEGTKEDPVPANVFEISDGDNESNIIRWLGAGLSISDTIALRFRVDLKDGETTEGLSVDVGGINTDNIKTAFVPDNESKNEYYLYIRGIETTEMNTALTIVVKKAGSNVSGTLTYSIANYAYEMQNSADENLKAFNNAMLKLGKSAKAYFETIQ